MQCKSAGTMGALKIMVCIDWQSVDFKHEAPYKVIV